MRNKKKIICILLILFFIISSFTISFAAESNFKFDDFNEGGNNTVNTAVETTMGTAIMVIRIIATGMSIIMLSYIGIKYMMAAPSEKADFKKSLAIYIFGAVLIFAAGNILGIIEKYVSDL